MTHENCGCASRRIETPSGLAVYPQVEHRHPRLVVIASIPRHHLSPWWSAVAAMMKSGCEKVCPTFRHSFNNSRHLSMLSSVTGRIFLARMGRNFCISQSFSAARWISPVLF
jgi:hypothetical protein